MKTVVGKKSYDTKAAKMLAEWDNGHEESCFNFDRQVLYKTAKGSYFLYGEGGAMSQWSVEHGNSLMAGKQIVPLAPEEAKDWLEDYGFVHVLRREFPSGVEKA
jgi:hypothetical protein